MSPPLDSSLRELGFNRRTRRALARRSRARRCLALTSAGFAVAKGAAAFRYIPRGATVFDVSFGFGDYVRSLTEAGRFEWRLDGTPLYAARMPLVPLIYAGLARISEALRTAAILKNLLLSTFTAASYGYLLNSFSRGLSADTIWVALSLLLCASPPVIKHAAAADYEEGFLLEVLFVWSASFLWMTRTLGDGRASRSPDAVAGLAVMSSTAALMMKTSMMPIFLLTDFVACAYSVRLRRYSVLSLVSLSVLPPLLWAVRNWRVTGQFSARTSWDGENLYRGWNSEALALYPDVCLDRLFDTSHAYTADGASVAIAPKATWSDFDDEWQFDDHCRNLAIGWMRSHPIDGAWFTWHKARNFFLSVRRSPYTYGADARDPGLDRLESVVTTIWLMLGRGLQLIMTGLVYRLWASGRRDRRAVASGVVAANAAYATPYLVGFNYERHITAYLVLVAACVGVMAGELA